MSGLLHRLAERVAGVAPRVRSNAALPYAAEALDWTGGAERAPVDVPAPDQREAVAAPPLPPEEARSTPAAGMPAPLAAAAARRANDAEAGSRVPPAAEPLSPAAAPRPAVAPAREAALSEPAPQWPRPLVRPGQPSMANADDRVPGLPEARPAAAASTAPPGLFPPRLMPAEPVTAAVGAIGTPAARVAPLPRLMPGGPVRVETMGTPAAGLHPPPATAGGRAVDAANEVHIHIGRIEVTAVREPAPRRPKPAAAPPLQSLDAYLATRNRR